jgi:hypothetical protein
VRIVHREARMTVVVDNEAGVSRDIIAVLVKGMRQDPDAPIPLPTLGEHRSRSSSGGPRPRSPTLI